MATNKKKGEKGKDKCLYIILDGVNVVLNGTQRGAKSQKSIVYIVIPVKTDRYGSANNNKKEQCIRLPIIVDKIRKFLINS